MQSKEVRKVLCWIFACTSVLYVALFLRSIYATSQNYAFLTLSNLLIFVLFEAVVAAVTGTAWWTILKGELTARAWGIAASLMYILIFLRPIIFRGGNRPVASRGRVGYRNNWTGQFLAALRTTRSQSSHNVSSAC